MPTTHRTTTQRTTTRTTRHCPTCTCPDAPQVWLTHLCHVCHTALRRAHPDPRGPRVCTTCLRIDAALAAAHDAALLTPLDPSWARGDGVLHTRLRPDDDPGARLAAHHVREVLRRLDALDPADRHGLAARYPAGPQHARVVDLDRWQHHVPPGPRASAEGYARYVADVHPWLVDLEPRVTDVDHLTALALAR